MSIFLDYFLIPSLFLSSIQSFLELALFILVLVCFCFSIFIISRTSIGVLSRGIYCRSIRYNFITCLKILNIPREEVKMQRQNFQEGSSTFIHYIHQHLTSMWRNVKEVSFELHIQKDNISIYFYAYHQGFRGEKCFKEAWKKIHSLKISLETRFPNIKAEIKEFDDLKEIFNIIDINSEMVKKKNFLIFRTNESEIWVSAILMRGRIEKSPYEKYSQIDSLVRGLTRLGIDAHFIVHFKAIKPSRVKKKRTTNRKLKSSNGEILVQVNENELEEREKELGHITGFWDVSSYIIVKTETEDKTEIRTTQVKNILTTVYSGVNYSPDIKILSGREIKRKSKKIVLRKSVGRTSKMASTRLAALIHFPEKPVPGIEAYEYPDFEIPPNTIFNYYTGIPTAYVLYKERKIFTCMLDPEDLRRGLAILGTVGSGKTRYVINLVDKLLRKKPLPMLIFENKGEFLGLIKSLPLEVTKNMVIICPGSEFAPLKINLFDPGEMESEDYARRLCGLINETLHSLFRIDGDLSLQMSRVLGEVLPKVVKEERYRNFEALRKLLSEYAENNRLTAPYVDSTVLAIDARLNVFRQGILSRVFDVEKTNLSLNELLENVVIIDFSYLLSQGGTKEDTKIIMNLIMLQVFQAGLRRMNSEELRHLVIVDDARFLVPEIFKRHSSGDTTIVEDMITIERGKGQGLVLICQDPAISKVALSNCNTRVIFRIAFKSPEEEKYIRLGLNIAEEQKRHLVIQPKREAIMKLADYPYPFRIRTLNQQIPKITFQEIKEHNMNHHQWLYPEKEIKDITIEEKLEFRDQKEKHINEILSWLVKNDYITVDKAEELIEMNNLKTQELLDKMHSKNELLRTIYVSPISGKQVLYHINKDVSLAFMNNELKNFLKNYKLNASIHLIKNGDKNKIIKESNWVEYRQGVILTFEEKAANQIKKWYEKENNCPEIISFTEKGISELKLILEKRVNENKTFHILIIGKNG
ncbi:MAG: ATP-binding protein [Candidatus Jordarchaeum sp.]|uniref:ATP-binding protein n=1 Tax=Candidatus Jordarchaeum sp. TaxID=2823881 RepID=UPI00404A6A4A